jgi:hypothetical protein
MMQQHLKKQPNSVDNSVSSPGTPNLHNSPNPKQSSLEESTPKEKHRSDKNVKKRGSRGIPSEGLRARLIFWPFPFKLLDNIIYNLMIECFRVI